MYKNSLRGLLLSVAMTFYKCGSQEESGIMYIVYVHVCDTEIPLWFELTWVRGLVVAL